MNKELADQFFQHLAETGKSLSTRQCYRRDVLIFLDWKFHSSLEDGELEPQHLQDFSNHLMEKNNEKPNSVRRKVIAVRMFARYCVDKGNLAYSPFDESTVPERDESLKCDLRDEDFTEMAEVLSQSTDLLGLRNRAIFHLLATEGLKASEITDIRIPDLLLKSKILSIRGDKGRTIVLSDLTVESIKNYLKVLRKKTLLSNVNGTANATSTPSRQDNLNHPQTIDYLDEESLATEALFFGYRGQGAALRMQSLSRHGLKFVLYELGEKVGLKSVNSENLRHLAITRMLKSGQSMNQVQKHLGIRQSGVIRKHVLKLQQNEDNLNSQSAEPSPIL
jgi:site-specific recombinase XerD